ncbi:MAG TPA: phosphatase PAP2 family protein [Blastocatellia bacterium]|nr:phosphatase PAP2 family protein [Blastocatellia bacterium]
MSSTVTVKQRIQSWQWAISAGVCGYLALGVATHTVKTYHWFLLLLIPTTFRLAERGRQFFLDWSPLFACWLIYDRFRLVQPYLLDRVAVESVYQLERWLFGWMAGGEIPAHVARAWLAAHAGEPLWASFSWLMQVIYLSHLFYVPPILYYWWRQGRKDQEARARFTRHIRAFTALHLLGFAVYLLLPVAPPWWISLHGMAQPSADLLAQTNIALGMDGVIVRSTIKTAPNWFAAVPSLHGAYPVLLALFALRSRRWLMLALVSMYGALMWTATVVLNQHYIADLLAGAALAVVSYWLCGGERTVFSQFRRSTENL